jgi:uncharacterized membrane protein
MVLVPALILPGAALLFGLGAIRDRWDPVPTLALGVITSLAFYPLGALLIYVVRLRLTTVSVVVEVDVFVALMLALGLNLKGRHRKQPVVPLLAAQDAHDVDGRRWVGWMVVVAASCAGILVLGLLVLPKATPVTYTEFYFTGAMAKLKGTVTVVPGAQLVLPIAVQSQPGEKAHYQIRARLDGSAFALDLISVPRSGTWKGSLIGTIDQSGCLHHLVIDLIPSGGSTVSSLDLWIQVENVGC